MGVALEKAGVDTSSFDTMYPQRRCYPGLKHSPKHILAAQELANLISSPRSSSFGTKEVIKGGALAVLKGRK
ncbi:T6SS effector amidase Tae4 family protein [Pseudoalteromonas ostreae]